MTLFAVVWDIDGVLIDSEPLHLEALRETLATDGLSVSDRDNAALLGLSLYGVWEFFRRHHGLRASYDAWAERIEDHYVAHVEGAMARPGAVERIVELTERGVPQACVSSAERRIVDANLAALGVADLIRLSVSRQDVERTKPDPMPYRVACERLGVSPADCLAIEDTEVGVTSAVAAGLWTVAWPHAMSADGDFRQAHRRVASLDEVPWQRLTPPGETIPAETAGGCR